MSFVDLHCDTVSVLLEQNKILAENDLNVSIPALKQADVFCQFFAMYVRLQEFATPEQAFERVEEMYAVFLREMKANSDAICLARCAQELEANRRNGKISAFLTVEEGGICGSNIQRLYTLYNMGVRLITLTWNFENALGYPNSDDSAVMSKGLRPFGIEFVQAMNHLGMLVDVSHLSDGGFWDVARCSTKPFVASHSNARAVRDYRRNLTDAQLRALASKGGITGINFFHRFLGYDETGSVSQMVEHIKHIKKVAGIDVLAIGSDFDGFSGPCEIKNSAELVKIPEALTEAGFTGNEVDKICYKNALRVIKDVL
ncbi:MAG TPA: dipeptidase [Clostridia bacterium]|nr:dipeptidase [Clostridia bacterium]